MRQITRSGTRGADEFIEAAEWALARKATIGTLLTTDDPPVWILPIVDVPRLDPLVLYYTFDATHVFLIWIDTAARSEN